MPAFCFTFVPFLLFFELFLLPTNSFTLFNNICLRHSLRLYLPSKTNDTNIFFRCTSDGKAKGKKEEKSKRVIKELPSEKNFKLMWRYKEKRWPLPIPYNFLKNLYVGVKDASVNCTWRNVNKNDGDTSKDGEKWLIQTFFRCVFFFSPFFPDRHLLATNHCIDGCGGDCDVGVSMNFSQIWNPFQFDFWW